MANNFLKGRNGYASSSIFNMIHESAVNVSFKSNRFLCEVFFCAQFLYAQPNSNFNIHLVKVENVTNSTLYY